LSENDTYSITSLEINMTRSFALIFLVLAQAASADDSDRASLAGIKSVRVETLLDSDQLSDQAFQFSKIQIGRDVERVLTSQGIKIDAQSGDATINVYVRLRELVSSSSGVRLFGYRIETSVHQQVSLNRNPTIKVMASTWRRADFGLGLQQAIQRSFDRLLERQLEQLAEGINGRPSSTTPTTPSGSVDLAKIRSALERVLGALGVGDASKAEITKLELIGTKVEFEATIVHRDESSAIERPILGKYRYSVETTAKGTFDLANPSSWSTINVCTKLPPLLGSREVCIPLGALASALTGG
jgi:hypothetical protein